MKLIILGFESANPVGFEASWIPSLTISREIEYNDRVARLHGYDIRVPLDVAWAGFRTTISWQAGKQTSKRSKAGKLATRDWNVSRPFEPCPPPNPSSSFFLSPLPPLSSALWPLPPASPPLSFSSLFVQRRARWAWRAEGSVCVRGKRERERKFVRGCRARERGTEKDESFASDRINSTGWLIAFRAIRRLRNLHSLLDNF